MLSPWQFGLALTLVVGCLLGVGAVAGWLIAECLDERDRRRRE